RGHSAQSLPRGLPDTVSVGGLTRPMWRDTLLEGRPPALSDFAHGPCCVKSFSEPCSSELDERQDPRRGTRRVVTDSELHRRPLVLDDDSPTKSLRMRRGLRVVAAMLVPESPKSYRQAISERGYALGAVLGRSRTNCGFTVVAVEKEGRRFAAKGTSEREFDGILTDTLKGEYDILRDLSHPGIVRAEELIEGTGGCAMVMELCAGVCVEHLMPQGSALSGPARHGVIWALLDAVAYLHRELVAHRDLHPLNVMVDAPAVARCASEGIPAEGAVKIVDFGSALRSTAGGGSCGAGGLEDNATQDILPPREACGDDPLACGDDPLACDVFALGLLAAGLAVGRPLRSADVVCGGALAVPERFLALSAPAAAHLCSMLALCAGARPGAGECLEALPAAEDWLAEARPRGKSAGAAAEACPSPLSELRAYIQI
ncbi:unnamed protein product, partial [Prorocentrum cordatum]